MVLPTRRPAPHAHSQDAEPAAQVDSIGRLRRRLFLERAVYGLVILALLFALYHYLNPGQACIILADGEPLAAVRSRRMAESILTSIKQRNAEDLGAPVQFRERIALEETAEPDLRVLRRWEADRLVAARLHPVVSAYWLKVDGRPLVAFRSAHELRDCLAQLVREYTPPRAQLLPPARFRERLTIQAARLSSPQAKRYLRTLEEALALLRAPAVHPTTYVIGPGDTATKIARRHKISLNDLQAANLGRDLNRIAVGDTLAVAGGDPPVTVIVRASISGTQEIPFWTEVQYTAELPPGKRQVERPGRKGKQRISGAATYINGRPVSRKVTWGEILEEAVPAKVLVGKRGRK